MNTPQTITAAIQVESSEKLLSAYRTFTGDATVLADTLFAFLATPTPERNEFLACHCSCSYSSVGNIVLSNYTAL